MLLRFFILVSLVLAACAPDDDGSELARQSLVEFFSYLEQGNYASAQELYGGSYEILVEMNPDLSLDNQAALLQNACQVNGFRCLNSRSVTFDELNSRGEYIFIVEFDNPDGSLFELGACCGDTPTNPPQFQFEYRVVKGDDDSFFVLDLPVYVP